MTLFLGVDGGQSGTVAVIGDHTGRVLSEGHAGPCNHASGAQGRAKFERALRESVNEAAAKAGVEPVFVAATLGLSGGPDDKATLAGELIQSRFLGVTHDAAIALSGATGGKPGVIVIAGTGSIAYGRNSSGREGRAGGWGYVFGDEGSAFDLVRQALRMALRMEEGWGAPTGLRAMLLRATGASDVNQLLHWFYAPEWPRDRVAALARQVDQLGEEGDAGALAILHGAAQELSSIALAVRARLFEAGETAVVSYAGGVFVSDRVRQRFEVLLGLSDGVEVRSPLYAPAWGALLEAYRLAGLDATIKLRV